jgi:hypothetical protein
MDIPRDIHPIHELRQRNKEQKEGNASNSTMNERLSENFLCRVMKALVLDGFQEIRMAVMGSMFP